jgi:hypothetical protein
MSFAVYLWHFGLVLQAVIELTYFLKFGWRRVYHIL